MTKTKEQIRFNMQKVKNKDSEIEIMLRRGLWQRNLRYRKNVKSIYGHPDIAFIKKKIAIFVDSEFWHGYDFEHRKNDFKTHQDFWISKIERNMERDREVNEHLQSEGWIVLRFWGKEIKNNLDRCVEIIAETVKNSSSLECGERVNKEDNNDSC